MKKGTGGVRHLNKKSPKGKETQDAWKTLCPWGDLTAEERRMINNVYREDFQMFGYEVDEKM